MDLLLALLRADELHLLRLEEGYQRLIVSFFHVGERVRGPVFLHDDQVPRLERAAPDTFARLVEIHVLQIVEPQVHRRLVDEHEALLEDVEVAFLVADSAFDAAVAASSPEPLRDRHALFRQHLEHLCQHLVRRAGQLLLELAAVRVSDRLI